jgi:hypothetical protein
MTYHTCKLAGAYLTLCLRGRDPLHFANCKIDSFHIQLRRLNNHKSFIVTMQKITHLLYRTSESPVGIIMPDPPDLPKIATAARFA